MNLVLHFLNVGNGDCTIVELPGGLLMMVDICNGGGTNRELTDPLDYLGRAPLRLRYVQTHPDMDHMGGLAGLTARHKVVGFWDTLHRKPQPDFQSPHAKGSRRDWLAYLALRGRAQRYYRGAVPLSWTPNGVECSVSVLHPTVAAFREAIRSGDWNHNAYVLLIRYSTLKALIAGDVDDVVWDELHDWASCSALWRRRLSNITVFKVSHHGRRSGYCGADWLRLANPQQIVISKGPVPGEHSAYGSYYDRVGSERLWLTSEGDVVCSYNVARNSYVMDYRRELTR